MVQAIFLMRFGVGAALAALGHPVRYVTVALGAGAWFLVTAAGYLLNGIADVTEDRANRSVRPIARGELTVDRATAVTFGLAGCGLVLAAMVSQFLVVLALAQLALGWWYSCGPAPLKRNTVSTAACVVASGLLTYVAGAHCAGARVLGQLWLFPVAMATWMAVGAVSKDLSDVAGDRVAGRRSLPIVLGERRARQVMLVTAATIALAFAVAVRLYWPAIQVAAWTVVVGAAALGWIACGRTSYGSRNRRRRPYLVFMVTQYLAHLTVLTRLAVM